MLRRRLLYLACLLGCFAFYIGYREWMAWIMLLSVLLLPILSLLLSAPAMLLTKVRFPIAGRATMGSTLALRAEIRSLYPTPPTQIRFCVTDAYNKNSRSYKGPQDVFLKHCGCVEICIKRAWLYDYLGLIRVPLARDPMHKVVVYPKPVPVTELPSLDKYIAGRWIPKVGGGFAENHDLRVYRPGDDLRLVHWKLSAKAKQIILREPIVPARKKAVLSLILSGNSDVLDQKLGQLLYLSNYLLQKELPHELHCLCGGGLRVFPLTSQEELHGAMDALLQETPTQERSIPYPHAGWHYRIGGQWDET